MRRRRAVTLDRLKDDAARELRERAREGLRGEALAALVGPIAERLAPSDEESLLSLVRHTKALGAAPADAALNPPGTRDDTSVRANVVRALARALALELRAIERGGVAWLERADENRGCC